MFVLSEDCCCKSALCCLLLTLVKSYSYSQSVSDISKAIKLLINVTDTFEFCDPVKMVRQTFYCSFLIQQIAGESFLGNNLPQNEKKKQRNKFDDKNCTMYMFLYLQSNAFIAISYKLFLVSLICFRAMSPIACITGPL